MNTPQDLGPNQKLINQAGSKNQLMTPAMVLDLDILEANIHRMAEFVKSKGLSLRPHSKTHKSIAVARKQIAEGALGVCCATLGEAEVMVSGGIEGVLITSPIVQPAKVDIVTALNGRAQGLMVVVDNMENLRALESASAAAEQVLRVLVDVDVGLHRTGATTVEQAVSVARHAQESAHLAFAGIQGYGGHLQHIGSFDERTVTTKADLQPLFDVRDALREQDLEPAIISGGGTGTHNIDTELDLFTELQAGSYTVMDVQYLAVQPKAESWSFRSALVIRATVVSANHEGSATIDAGLKCFATDGPRPGFASGVPVGAHYEYFGDEHGRVVFTGANEQLNLGDVVNCVVPHCDPTINLHDIYHCVRGDTLVDIWPVDARGRH
ncbi:MAG: DSD1 family PLP-dependent enzyme [Rhodospirillaceae bacterium]|nr:DSD1 family PLP-dependent enzyme [Rhodospirillaceae bacterium]